MTKNNSLPIWHIICVETDHLTAGTTGGIIINKLKPQCIFNHFPGTPLSCLSVGSLVIIISKTKSSHIGRLVISPHSSQRQNIVANLYTTVIVLRIQHKTLSDGCQALPPMHITPRCLLCCLKVNTGVWMCLCLCFKQPGLLWLHSTQGETVLMASFGLIQQQKEDTGDKVFWSQVEYKHVCTSHVTLTNVPKEIKMCKSFTKYFVRLLSSFLSLTVFI